LDVISGASGSIEISPADSRPGIGVVVIIVDGRQGQVGESKLARGGQGVNGHDGVQRAVLIGAAAGVEIIDPVTGQVQLYQMVAPALVAGEDLGRRFTLLRRGAEVAAGDGPGDAGDGLGIGKIVVERHRLGAGGNDKPRRARPAQNGTNNFGAR